MEIQKVINNNIVSSLDEQGQEVVVMGRGLGFKAKVGQEIDSTKVEKVFALQNQDVTQQFKELLASVPLEHVRIANDTISYAMQHWASRLNPNIFVTLTDHINFAIVRHEQKMTLTNPLLMEIKRFYPNEYQTGCYAIDLIQERLHLSFSKDEAGFIAMHFVNAEYQTGTEEELPIEGLVRYLEDIMEIKLVKTTLCYERFMTHLTFLIQRVHRQEVMAQADEFDGLIRQRYPYEYDVAKKLAAYIERLCQWQISEGEIIYLTIHIRRLICAEGQEEV